MSRSHRAVARARAQQNDLRHLWVWLSFLILFAVLAFAPLAHAAKELIRRMKLQTNYDEEEKRGSHIFSFSESDADKVRGAR